MTMETLKFGLILAAFSAVVFMSTTKCEDIETKVLILGAGVSGMVAAETLIDKNMTDFIILEGSDDIGGRLRSHDFHGTRINLGANWIHFANSKDNVIWELKEQYDISGKISNFNNVIMYDEKGDKVSDAKVNEADESLENKKKELEKLFGNKTGHGNLNQMSCGYRDQSKCMKEMSIRSGLKYVGWNPKTPVEKTLEFFSYDAEYADDPDTTSLNSTLYLEEGNTDDHFFVTDPRGFDIFLQEIKNNLSSEVLKLKKNVTSVDWTASDKVIVHTEDGSKYKAEYAICTFSIGVLANNMGLFKPPLPPEKLTEIYKFRMTWFTKIFIKFPSAFWAENEWILYADSRRGYYPVFGNLNAAISNTLLLIVVGEESRRIEGQNDTKTQEEIMTILTKIYNEDIEDPEDIYVTKWGMDPLQYGSFSNWPPEVSEECYRNLQAPVGRLHFAGEATHEKYNGYLQGAYLTGQEQAKLVLQALCGSHQLGAVCGSRKLDSTYSFVFLLVAIHVCQIF